MVFGIHGVFIGGWLGCYSGSANQGVRWGSDFCPVVQFRPVAAATDALQRQGCGNEGNSRGESAAPVLARRSWRHLCRKAIRAEHDLPRPGTALGNCSEVRILGNGVELDFDPVSMAWPHRRRSGGKYSKPPLVLAGRRVDDTVGTTDLRHVVRAARR